MTELDGLDDVGRSWTGGFMSVTRGLLVIVPQSNLTNLADLVAAANGSQVTALDGYVTGREALKEIGSGRYQVVYFGGHSDLDDLQMSDGPLNEEYLQMALRSGNVEMVILNSCASIAMAAKLYRSGVTPRAVGWRQEDLGDRTAIDWAKAFFRSLALGADYWEAYMNSVAVMRGSDADFEAPVFLNGRIVLLEQRVTAIQERLENMDGKALVPHWQIGLVGLVLLAVLAVAALLVV